MRWLLVIGHSANSGSSWRLAEYDGETEAQPGTLAPKVLHRDVFRGLACWAGVQAGWGFGRQPLTGILSLSLHRTWQPQREQPFPLFLGGFQRK